MPNIRVKNLIVLGPNIDKKFRITMLFENGKKPIPSKSTKWLFDSNDDAKSVFDYYNWFYSKPKSKEQEVLFAGVKNNDLLSARPNLDSEGWCVVIEYFGNQGTDEKEAMRGVVPSKRTCHNANLSLERSSRGRGWSKRNSTNLQFLASLNTDERDVPVEDTSLRMDISNIDSNQEHSSSIQRISPQNVVGFTSRPLLTLELSSASSSVSSNYFDRSITSQEQQELVTNSGVKGE